MYLGTHGGGTGEVAFFKSLLRFLKMTFPNPPRKLSKLENTFKTNISSQMEQASVCIKQMSSNGIKWIRAS